MGPVPTYRHQVPILASGKGAGAFAEAMKPFGMKITLMGLPAGSAAATKMFRSIFMKGFVSLLLEMLVAAERYDVADEVLISVVKTMTSGPLPEVINGLVCRGVVHSQRREHEMAEVVATLDSIGIDSIMSRATIDKLKWVTSLGLKEHFRGVPPGDFHEIFSALKAEEAGHAPGWGNSTDCSRSAL